MVVLSVCITINHMHAVPAEPSRGHQNPPPKLGLTGDCELPCWCWALKPQSSGIVARFLTTEPSLQSQTGFELAISLPLFQGVEIIGMHHHVQP